MKRKLLDVLTGWPISWIDGDGRGWAEPTQRKLAEALGITVHSVQSLLRDLIDEGWVAKTKKPVDGLYPLLSYRVVATPR